MKLRHLTDLPSSPAFSLLYPPAPPPPPPPNAWLLPFLQQCSMHKTFWALRADLQASDVTALSSTMRRVVQQLRIHASNEMLMKVAAYKKKQHCKQQG